MGDSSTPQDESQTSTPNPRFASQGNTAEELLKEQTVGLVHLSDFRKRRVEALEVTERGTPGGTSSGASTPDGRDPTTTAVFKKKKKVAKKGGLSFGGDDEEHDGESSAAVTPRSKTPAEGSSAPATDSEDTNIITKKRLKPNTSVGFQPKAMTKSAMAKEAQVKEKLRKEFTQMQEAVKQTEFMLPFVFFDGSNAPGGSCRMKKGDHTWLFLERARKVGADLASKGDKTKKYWARISVDDLMIVRGDIIIPHHYEFYYFIVNKSIGYNGTLFSYASEPTRSTPKELLPSENSELPTMTPEETSQFLSTAASRKQQQQAAPPTIPDSDLEGYDADPTLLKVVDRRWYERNKHIYPASTWEDFDPDHDYSKGGRKDTQGNSFFFSR